ncbi:MAG: Extracellular solute-binding protein family 5 [Candidatus Curtissbacteria bacterium GW2011_GWA1_40_24]|uniref:Extracellular solute-binding protein family 5 n=1 Tax=Candidatus Curtissbacteria bacterium GW2011_GWA1_40_24 TaxID=1618406 RepID=A0A0G0UWZ9_9BACT|nr:MAG: Extracellular solute-binding protein family 5 [Candidatus Curtissbacteria bacterium GW2011_GWA1_40_24]
MFSYKVPARRFKFWVSVFSAYITRYKFWIFVFVLVLLITIVAFKIFWSQVSRNNVVAIGYVGTYTLESIPANALALATDSLIVIDKSGRPQPAMASHWTTTEDGKKYIVFLKDNLKWHDDTQVDAKDISLAVSGVSIVALNNKAIEFDLKTPLVSFLQTLDKPVFKRNSFYGTGQFRIVDIKKIEEVVKEIKLTPKDKNLPKVEIKFYAAETQALEALKIGEVKVATVSSAQELANWPNLEVEKNLDETKVITIFYNTDDPLLSSKEFRQALNYAINRQEFDGVLAQSPIYPSSWTFNEAVKGYDYNSGKAKELISKSQIENPQVTLTVGPALEEIAGRIANDWEAIGVKVVVKKEKTVPSDFQALLAVNELPWDPDQYALWHSTQTKTNITKYKNVRVDKLLEDARVTKEEDKRKDLYFEFQKVLAEDAPAAFLYFPYKYRVVYKNIKPLLSKLPE